MRKANIVVRNISYNAGIILRHNNTESKNKVQCEEQTVKVTH